MQLLPYSRFTLKTHESLLAVINKLDAHIEAPKPFRKKLSRNHAPYTGTISSDGFEIRRIIHYRNSFLPKTRGRFESGSQGFPACLKMNKKATETQGLLDLLILSE